MLSARGKHRVICDADLSMPIDQMERFFVKDSGCVEIAIGSREMPMSRRLGEPFSRRLMGRIYNILVKGIGVRGITDSPRGFTRFPGEPVFPPSDTQPI